MRGAKSSQWKVLGVDGRSGVLRWRWNTGTFRVGAEWPDHGTITTACPSSARDGKTTAQETPGVNVTIHTSGHKSHRRPARHGRDAPATSESDVLQHLGDQGRDRRALRAGQGD